MSFQAINFVRTKSLRLIHIYEERAAAGETSMCSLQFCLRSKK